MDTYTVDNFGIVIGIRTYDSGRTAGDVAQELQRSGRKRKELVPDGSVKPRRAYCPFVSEDSDDGEVCKTGVLRVVNSGQVVSDPSPDLQRIVRKRKRVVRQVSSNQRRPFRGSFSDNSSDDEEAPEAGIVHCVYRIPQYQVLCYL